MDYSELYDEYKKAKLLASNLLLTLGSDHPRTITAIAEAQELGKKMKATEAGVAQWSRPIGNYTRSL